MASIQDELRTEYRDASRLDARIRLHQRYTVAAQGWFEWVMDQLLARIPATARVVEVGCGSGRLWQDQAARIPSGWRLALADLSTGMPLEARANLQDVMPTVPPLLCGDIQALPFADGSVDALIANHMLYHVPSRPQAYAEVARVLRPGGLFFAATNGRETMWEYDYLVSQARGEDDAGRMRRIADAKQSTGFNLEHGGDELRAVFPGVELLRYESTIVVHEAQPLLDYAEASSHIGDAGIERLRELIEEELSKAGELSIEKHTGMFVARTAE